MSTPPAGIERMPDRLDKPLLDDRSYRVIKLSNQLEALLIHDNVTEKASAAMDIAFNNDSTIRSVPTASELGLIENDLWNHNVKANSFQTNQSANYYFELDAISDMERSREPGRQKDMRAPLFDGLERFARLFFGGNRRHLCARHMKLVVLGKEELDEVQEWVEELFSPISSFVFVEARPKQNEMETFFPEISLSLTPLSTQARPRPEPPSRMPVRPNPDVVYEPEIVCRLGKVEVAAFPDMGASRNIISYNYALRHRLKIDKSATTVTKTAAGSRIKTLGTVSLPFSFAKETPVYVQEFHVLPKCCHNVILGNPFLRLTETFSHFAHRVGKKVRGILPAHRVCFTGSAQQWLAGCANDQSVLALPDTGSDICLMSLEYAQARGYYIDRDEKHRKKLEFVDGSTSDTLGLVDEFEWKFKPSEAGAYHPNVYVLEGLHADILLSYDFLMETQAFSVYAESFEDVGGIGLDDVDAWDACFARLVTEETGLGKLGESIKRRLLGSQGNGASAPTASQSWHARRPVESALYEQRCKAALALPEPDRSKTLADALGLWQRFFDSRPAA